LPALWAGNPVSIEGCFSVGKEDDPEHFCSNFGPARVISGWTASGAESPVLRKSEQALSIDEKSW
jgi:hypothetical protein